MATKGQSDGDLHFEDLRFRQLTEVIDAFMERLPAGDLVLQLAHWDTRRHAKHRAAFLAFDAVGLKRLNDGCERDFKKIESEYLAILRPSGRAATLTEN